MTDLTLRDSRSADMVGHPSALAALRALEGLAAPHSFKNILDLGCGSGLLALRAAQLWPQARVIAADISEKAVEDAAFNIREHGLEARVWAVRSEGYANPLIGKRKPYDLVLANLLAEWLVAYAAELEAHLAPGGIAVISGILAWKRTQVEQAHAALRFEILDEIVLSSWHALVLRKC